MTNFQWSKLRLLAFLFLGFSIAVPSVFSEQKFILEIQIDGIKKKIDDINRKIKKLEVQLASMNQTFFTSEADRLSFEARKQAIRAEIIGQQNELKEIQQQLGRLNKKKTFFPQVYQGGNGVYFFKGLDAKAYDDAFGSMVKIFLSIFPSASIDFQFTPQIILYGSQEDLVAYEISDKTSFSTLLDNPRFNDKGFLGTTIETGNKKHFFLTTFADPNMDGFRHEVARLLLYRFLDPSNSPGKVSSTSSFLVEGFAENMATINRDEMYEKHVQFAMDHAELIKLMDVAGLIRAPFPESEKADLRAYFTNESVLFVRWLSSFSNGFQLLKQLFDPPGGQYESLIMTHQWNRGVARNGLEEYYRWREGEIERIRAKKAGGTPEKVAPSGLPAE